ncbi:hypothetical protein G6O45_31725, partial [Salmonella enterica subsp. enterica serovar Istanbul]|nr:hypothetical protein [Salmonella enterica subsp. enterica serovar Istanbul]
MKRSPDLLLFRALSALAALATSVLLLGAPRVATASDATPMRVGSKRFVESYILAEMVAQIARSEGAASEHEQG